MHGDMDLDAFVGLETEVWEALRRGDAQADADLLAEDFLGVYASGFAGRSDHAGQLANGPTVSEYELHGARLILISEHDALLCYRADWRRVATGEQAATESMYVSSLWSKRSDRWLNVFSQDTSAETSAA